MKRGQFCIAVTDRRELHLPIKFISRGSRPGKLVLTDNRPTFGRDGEMRVEDRILYFLTIRDLYFMLRRLPNPPRYLFTPYGPGGPIQ